MGPPLLAVTSFAVDITVGAITSYDGVQHSFAVFAFETFAMPGLQIKIIDCDTNLTLWFVLQYNNFDKTFISFLTKKKKLYLVYNIVM